MPFPPTSASCLPPTSSCRFCGATLFPYEPKGLCYSQGQIQLACNQPPPALYHLMISKDEDNQYFCQNIRTYNLFTFTSMGVKLDSKVVTRKNGIYTFRAQGQIYHYINSLQPPNTRPKYLQLYFYDTENELQHRSENAPQLCVDIIESIMRILSENPYAKFLCSLKDVDIDEVCSIAIRTDSCLDQRTYNAPSASQFVAIWVEEESTNNKTRDIFVHKKSSGSQRVMHYHGCYDLLQYPLLFPYGEIGWHRNMKRKGKNIPLETQAFLPTH
ncbi:hypothetical protein ACSBR2_004602 [Camellia fascicularis]